MSNSVLLTDEFLLETLDKCRMNDGGTDFIVCSCGCLNFNDGHQPEPGDLTLEQMRARAGERGKGGNHLFCGHDATIHWIEVGDELIVLDCPCGQDLKLAKALWESRSMIAHFLDACADEIRKASNGATWATEKARRAALFTLPMI